MTLNEKFELSINYQLIFGLVGVYQIKRAASNVEKVADDYAIEFAEWIDDFYFQGDEKNQYHLSIKRLREGEYFNVKELLEIFKKEKGL